MAQSKDIILYHYRFSPYARRIVWYLTLRNIPYTECIQPPILPRADLNTLGIEYRRIPVLAIGKDIYHDTRLIINKLNVLFPPSEKHPGLEATNATDKALESLLSKWINGGGIFRSTALLIPTSLPLFKDPKFTKDRAQMSGRSWSPEALNAARPEALVEIRSALTFIENNLLTDGQDWIGSGNAGPGLADLEAVWPIHWLFSMPGAIPETVASGKEFPKVWKWVGNFSAKVKEASKRNNEIKNIKGDVAAEAIYGSEYAEEVQAGIVQGDQTGLRVGQEILVHPTDSGQRNKDKGKLIKLDWEEIVYEVTGQNGKSVRVHAPRHGFRIIPVVEEAKI